MNRDIRLIKISSVGLNMVTTMCFHLMSMTIYACVYIFIVTASRHEEIQCTTNDAMG